jgi:DNA-binding beta-propeller fold protein YncE
MWAGIRLTCVTVALGAAVVGCGSAPASPQRTLAAPVCSTAVAAQSRLHDVRTAFVSTVGSPFGVVTAPSGGWAFMATLGHGIDVLSDRGFVPKVVHQVALPGDAAVGETITRDGRYVLAADNGGAVVVDAGRAEQGRGDAALGHLRAPKGGAGAIEVATSSDGRFAFVTLEGTGAMAVFNLRAALADQFRAASFVGDVPLGIAPVGMALSPDGRWLYVTSEVGAGAHGRYGSLKVIDVHTAETHPGRAAVVSSAVAGCGPVRVVVSADGGTVWVTARESDALLAFSAAKLRSDPAHALLARVRVGEAPVGLALVDHDTRVVVADSNRFGRRGDHSELTVVNAAAALAGRPAIAGSLPAGAFPREEAVVPDGHTLLVGNFQSGQLEAVDTTRLP